MISLKELCSLTNVSRRAIQGYEKMGLVKPAGRNERGYLLYESDEVERIKYIKLLQDAGFSVKEIKAFEESTEAEKERLLRQKLAKLNEQAEKIKDTISGINKILENQ